MKISDHIKETFLKRVKEKKCLVIYDPDKRYKEIVHSLKSGQNIIIDASESVILARENALSEWLSLKDKKHLLIYLPYRKPVRDTDKRMNPFEIFAIGGSVFPDGDGDSYKSICLQVYPDNAEQIEELFTSGEPVINAVDSLKGDMRWPILKTNLNAESSKDSILSIMCPTEKELQFFKDDYAFFVEELRPIQLSRFDFDEYLKGRNDFSRDEWMDIIIRSIGLEPAKCTRRLKFHHLARLFPFVESNFNFIELGPRGTGKSYSFSEFSPYSTLISGGQATTPILFYNNARRNLILVGV